MKKRIRLKRMKKNQQTIVLHEQLEEIKQIIQSDMTADEKVQAIRHVVYPVGSVITLNVPIPLYIAMGHKAIERGVTLEQLFVHMIAHYCEVQYDLTIDDYIGYADVQEIQLKVSSSDVQKWQQRQLELNKTEDELLRYVGSHFIRGVLGE